MHKTCPSNKRGLGHWKSTQVFLAIQNGTSYGRLPDGLVCGEGEETLPQIHHKVVRLLSTYNISNWYYGAI